MELREITYIHKIAELGNLTKAAKDLHITQPSLSQSIKNIEKKLGIVLFYRSKKGVSLTEVGEKFINDSIHLVHDYQIFMSKVNSYNQSSKTYHIGLYKLAYTTHINDAIMNFMALNSKYNFNIKVDSIQELENKIISTELDIAIIKYPPIYSRSTTLQYKTLFKEKLYVILHKNDPLSRKKSLKMSDLINKKLITSDKKEYPHQMLAHLMNQTGVELQVITYTNYSNINMIIGLVENEFGITFATKQVCTYYQTPLIKCIPIEEEVLYDICVVHRVQNNSNPDIEKLVGYISTFQHF